MTNDLEYKDMYKHKMDLIQKAIDDTQNTIRFTDTKAAAIIGFWGIISTILIRTADSWTLWLQNFQLSIPNLVISLILVLMIFFLVKSVSLAYLVVVPKTNPIKHVQTGDRSAHELYFISKLNKPLSGRRLYRVAEDIQLEESTENYYNKIKGLDTNELMRELVIELQKVSFIRSVKVDRANAAITTVINFLILLLILLLYIVGNKINLGSLGIMFSLNLNIELLATLIIGHLIGDYLLQTDNQAMRKQDEWLPLLLHCFVYTCTLAILSYLLLGVYNWTMVFIIFVSHILIDKGDIVRWWTKRIKGINNPETNSIKSVLASIDQTFHYLVIFILSCSF
ncbi:DUF3307 domain-containing protein [Paenibacillus sp. OK003]|uniref:DUF3307 domain-containing protein n=1 Tax=Paenibacillus sp. OK003 TaxID=1884380 RepID=UPI0008BFD261|nr:DUF3307 domain-containing protein [Paenibacillus sp. OK003]SEL79616.1 Protein of unknown function [Paenibacillus sp. OK003]